MADKLKKITQKYLKTLDLVEDGEGLKSIYSSNEPLYMISSSDSAIGSDDLHDLLKIEIAVRKGERFGLFTN